MQLPSTSLSLSLSQVRDRLPHLKMIVQYSSDPLDPEQQDQGVVPWAEFMELGKVRLPRIGSGYGLNSCSVL